MAILKVEGVTFHIICIIGHLILEYIHNSENIQSKETQSLNRSTEPRRLGLEINGQYFGTDSNFAPTCSGQTPKRYILQLQKGGCKKVGLLCSPACTNCQGQSCSNAEWNTTDEDSYDVDEETADSFSFEQFINMQQEVEEIEEDVTVEIEVEECESD